VNNGRLFQGYLVYSPDGDLTRENILTAPSLKYTRILTPSRWDEYRYVTHHPLRGEEQIPLAGTFEYSVLARRSGSRMVIASESLAIVDAVLTAERAAGSKRKLSRVAIAVDELVRRITTEPGRYVLTRVDALVPAQQALRAITFYGSDIGEAGLFRENIGRLECYACGLRDVALQHEIVRVSNRGILSFRHLSAERIGHVDKVLNYINLTNLMRF
jgi:hypothetical protein